jgi:hypothetical protein
MSERNHGRRYSFKEKKEILDYLEKHTYKDTSEKFKISETTLSRWRKEIKSGSKINKKKIIISLPKFWLEYLNEQIESDVWEDYSDAVLNTIRNYSRNQKSMKNADSKYVEKVKQLIPKLLELNPNIDAMLVSREDEVIYESEQWGSTEGTENLIEIWKRTYEKWINGPPWWKTESKRSGRIKEFEFQNKKYHIRDMSVKHLVGVRKIEVPSPIEEDHEKTKFILGLKRKLAENHVHIFAKGNNIEGNSLLLAMDTLKRVAMGSLPPISEESSIPTKEMLKADLENKLQKRKEYIEKSQNLPSRSDEYIGRRKKELAKNYAWWEAEKERTFKLKTYPILMRVATKVNVPLEFEEKKVLEALEKQLGKKIERISPDFEQEISRNDFMPAKNGKLIPLKSLVKLPWMHVDEYFAAHKFPCHYIALDGKIILLTLLSMNLSGISSEITKFENLTYLNLNSNNLIDLPKRISNLISLENMFLDNNKFTIIPEGILELPSLQKLSMQNNKISQIPIGLTQNFEKYKRIFPGIGECRLDFSGNKITHESLSLEQKELVRQLILLI